MLLFLLRDNFRELPRVPSPTAQGKTAYAAELLVAGVVLSAWCVLRLSAAHSGRFLVDSVLAVPCLMLGLWVALRSARDLNRGARRSALR